MNKTTTSARMRRDGTLHKVAPDGSEQQVTAPAMRAMTDEQIHAAALADPDAQPLTDADMAKLRLVPRTKTLRRALGLTQEEFAARYQIPLGTLRDWEQGKTQPDQPARAYLKAIAGNPEAVQQALRSASMGPR
jgi:putative transcriptional regulator